MPKIKKMLNIISIKLSTLIALNFLKNKKSYTYIWFYNNVRKL